MILAQQAILHTLTEIIHMPVFIRVRLAAIRLARALRRSILKERTLWEVDVDEADCPLVEAGPFCIVLVPRAVRLFDALHVYCHGAEIWIPLWWRLRLRNAMRLVIVESALELLDSSGLSNAAATSKSGRHRTRQKQTA
jgi:hypothetical protein